MAKEFVKKTLIIDPLMDNYVRKTWSILIDNGYDATYSTALNVMLLVAIMETKKEDGLSEETKDIIWKFAHDPTTIVPLNLQDHLARLQEHYGRVKLERG